jgi:hypothetical protein
LGAITGAERVVDSAVAPAIVESLVVPREVIDTTWSMPTEVAGVRGSVVDALGSLELEEEQAVNALKQKTRTHGTAPRCVGVMAEKSFRALRSERDTNL